MPWYKTKHIVPPMDKEITSFNNGVRTTKKFEPYDIYDGKGKLNDNFGDWWSYEKDLPDPPEDKDTGIDHMVVYVQEDKVEPKIVKGKAAPKGPDVLGEGSLDNR